MANVLFHAEKTLIVNYARSINKQKGIVSVSDAADIKLANELLESNPNLLQEALAWANEQYAKKTATTKSIPIGVITPGTADYDLFVDHGE